MFRVFKAEDMAMPDELNWRVSLPWNWLELHLETCPLPTPWTSCLQILFQCLYFLSQLKISVEGKIYHKFDMKPHHENIEKYRKLFRERTNKYLTKSRQIQVIDNDNANHMRPKPGFFATKASGFADKKKVPSKGLEMKRTRRDRDEMDEIMFKLFERKPN